MSDITKKENILTVKYFQYSNKETDYLKKRDPILGATIDRIGLVKREINTDIFSSLISSIISQQISTKSAITVENRLKELIGDFTAENILAADVDSIQKCGMSMRKASYIKGIGEAAISNEVDFPNLHNLPDEEVIKELTSLKGVGEWTAEMLLIHSLERPDILSFKDLGIRRGLMRLYGLDEISKEDFEIYRERYSPYGTVTSLYLWEIS